jgi:hypothetical protein
LGFDANRSNPSRRETCCPANAVTPVASRLSLTTKSEAMKSNAGSPKSCEGPIQVDRHRQAVGDEHDGDRR